MILRPFTVLGAWSVFCVSSILAEFPTSQPYPEIEYRYIKQDDPPRQIHVAMVDLRDADVSVRVAPSGADPDGEGPFQTVLSPQGDVANREDFDLCINGDFFSVGNQKGEDGKPLPFRKGVSATVSGPAVTDGKTWSTPARPRAVLIIDDQKRASIGKLTEPPKQTAQAVAGSDVIIANGENIARTEGAFATTTHPRTAVGIMDGGSKLVFVVVDGRKPDRVGMSLSDLSNLMLQLGCTDAINLDGGGSSEMTLRNPETGILHIINKPSDGRERAVGNVLGIKIKGTKQAEEVQAAK